jgi:DNA-binding MarR family transcriptional regulator
MVTARDLPTDRLAIGQLLGRLLYYFRQDMLDVAGGHGYPDLRAPHLQIFGNVGINGIRLTDLAARAQLSLAAASEFVTELEQLGYLERRPDPADGRAKLIFPTVRGRHALDDAGDRVAEIEQTWARLGGDTDFQRACHTLQRVLDRLDANNPDTTNA